MGGLDNLLMGFGVAITPFNLVMAVVGIILGTIIGVLPGLGGANGVAGGNPVKSFASILLGFILAAVGLDTVTGKLRMTFGAIELMRGFSFIVAVIGLFGLGEIFLSVEEGLEFRGVTPRVRFREMLTTWRELLGYWRTFLSGSLIGFWMGFKPGGATPASFMSYGFARRFSRHPEKFGSGLLEGV